MKKICVTVLALVCAAAAAVAACHWKPSQWKDVFVMPFHKDEKTVQLSLKEGESLRSFAQKLVGENVVADRRNLLYWLDRKGADRSLRAGTYRLSSGPSWYVAGQLKDAVPSYLSATILPGALPQKPFPLGSPEEQKAALNDLGNFPEAMRAILPDAPEGRAAFLLPETYSLTDASLPELVRQASSAWHARFGARLPDKGSAVRTAVIASLLQREAQHAGEYPVIAGVIENRLARNMPLQIDASVVYAWRLLKGETLKRVLFKHLSVASPYNTYKTAGLPPLPICVPSLQAWEGALSPEKNDFLYYVARGDGSHCFAKTASAHQKNVALYRNNR